MAECGDYVITSKGSGWVTGLQSDHKGNIMVYPKGTGDRDGWFVVPEKDALVIPEPPEAVITVEFWKAVARWVSFFENKTSL